MDELTKEKIMELGSAIGTVKDEGFIVTAKNHQSSTLWHNRKGVVAKTAKITGSTFDIKDRIKSLGGKFKTYSWEKGWEVPITPDTIDELISIAKINGVKMVTLDSLGC